MKFRRKARSARFGRFRRFARRGSRKLGIGSSNSLVQVDAMAYGALREKVSTMIAPVSSKIPLGNISDEVAMGLVNWLVAKKTSGLLRNIAMKGLVIENARIGEAIVQGQIGLGGGSTTSNYGGI